MSDNRITNLLIRSTKQSRRRPQAPRELRYSATLGLLSWKAPVDRGYPFTHYRVRFNTDGGEPDYELSAGQVSLQFRGLATVYLSTYNATTGLESTKVSLAIANTASSGSVPTTIPTSANSASIGTYQYAKDADGFWHWGLSFVKWTIPDSDPNFVRSELTVQLVNASGTPDPVSDLGTERKIDESMVAGVEYISTGVHGWWIPPADYGYRYHRFRLYGVNQAEVKTLYTGCWPGAADYFDALPAVQVGAIEGGRIDPASLVTAAFASTIRPVTLVATGSALPTLPNPLYPPGVSFAYIIDAHTLVKVNAANNAWERLITGFNDVAANTITANEIYAHTITAGQIAAGAITTTELVAGEILVGLGGGKPTRFRVNDGNGNMVGFIGDNGAGFTGAYFVNVLIGPTIGSAVISANSGGVTINGAPLTLNLNGVTTRIENIAGEASGYAGLEVSINHTGNVDFSKSQVQGGRIVVQRDIWMSGFSLYTSGGVQLWADPSTGAGDILVTRGVAASGQYSSVHVYANGSGSYLSMSASSVLQDKIKLACETAPYIDVVGGSFKISGNAVINSSGQFVGAGVACTGYEVAAATFNPYVGGVQYTGATGTTATVPIRTNAGDLEYYNGSTWVSVGTSGIVLTAGNVIVVKGGAVVSMS